MEGSGSELVFSVLRASSPSTTEILAKDVSSAPLSFADYRCQIFTDVSGNSVPGIYSIQDANLFSLSPLLASSSETH